MSLSLEAYRTKLINNILQAHSQDEVKRYIEAAMKALEKSDVNGHIISRFVDKTIDKIDLFNPMNKDAQQWSNITFSKILFNRIKVKFSTSTV